MVGTFVGIKSGVRVAVDRKQVEEDDIFGKKIVEFGYQRGTFFFTEGLVDVEVCIEAGSVNARVGTSATRDGNVFLVKH